MSGIDDFRKKIKGYSNKATIGFVMGELISIEPITIKIMYGNEPLQFTCFKSLINMTGLKIEDIGKLYSVHYDLEHNLLYVLGDIHTYENYYCVGGE